MIKLGHKGRVTGALVGLSIVAFLLYHSGLETVSNALVRAAPLFPWILLLEVGVLACTMSALRLLYDEDRHQLPIEALIRAALIGYSVMGLVPAGRTVAESARAALLARYSTGARAAVAAARMQAIALLANSAISIPATVAMFYILGRSVVTFMIFGNMVITAVLGFGILLAGQRSNFGSWLSTRLGPKIPWFQKLGKEFKEFDDQFSSRELIPVGPLLWEVLGRVLQVAQNGVLVLAVGGKLGLLPALCSEALHLVGAAAGDLIPAQLGATEINYQLSAHALELRPSDALSIALLAHLAQLVWVTVGLLIPLFWPYESVAPVDKIATEEAI